MSKKSVIFLLSILSLSFFLDVLGIGWGTPGSKRNKLYFENKEQIKESLRDITPEKVRKSKTEYKEELSGSRFNPVRSYHPDESQFIESLSNMNPKKLDFNPHYFYYGTLYFWFLGLALAIAFLFGLVKLIPDLSFFYFHPEELGRFYIAGRMVSVVFAVLTCFLVFLIARKLYGEKKALISSLFLSLTPIFVINAHYVAVDITEVFFITLSFFLSLKILESEKNKWYIFAGIVAGFAGSAKYPGILIILTIPIASFLKGGKGWANLLRSFLCKKVLLSYLFAIGAFLFTNPFIVTSYNEVIPYTIAYREQAEGMQNLDLLGGSLFYLKALYYGVGLPLLVLSLIGVVYVFYKKEKGEVLMLFWVIFSFLLVSSISVRSDRYILVIIPFIAILAAKSLNVFKNKYLRGGVLAAVSIFSFLYTFAYDQLFIQENIRTTAGKWIAENIPQGAKVGLKRDPYQFETPPLNHFKYKLCITGTDLEEIRRQSPQYFIVSEIEYRRSPQIWDEAFEKTGYKIIKDFSHPPKFFGLIPFNHRNVHEDYLYIYPKIWIYEKVAGCK